jgi:Mrp family chromosome partitioning ATPase
MDHIINALERAGRGTNPQAPTRVVEAYREPEPARADAGAQGSNLRLVEVSTSKLESLHIVAHDIDDPRSRAFNLLRTQVVHAMDAKGWRLLAVTSPTAGCGKTFTALNLALSLARQSHRSAILVDLDLQKPQVGKRLGIQTQTGLRALLEGNASLDEAMLQVGVGPLRFRVIPTERPSTRSSDWLSSNQMVGLLEQLKNDPASDIVILDLPPILAGDDVLSILPLVDCVLMVISAGQSRADELRQCADYLKGTPVVKVALNNAPETMPVYY